MAAGQRLAKSDNTEQLQAHFEQSASELVAACKSCCDETDVFLDFLNKFLSKVKGVYGLSGGRCSKFVCCANPMVSDQRTI